MDTAREAQLDMQSLKFEFTDKQGGELLRELVLYISEQCLDDPDFGSTKLNKILFFADFAAYARYGEPITGTPYIRLPYGPVPELWHRSLKAEMEEAREIGIFQRNHFGFEQQRIFPLRPANIKMFKPEQIALVDQVIRELHGRNATEVSELSHKRAWLVAGNGEHIPYNAVFLSDEGITEEDLYLTDKLIAEHGWKHS